MTSLNFCTTWDAGNKIYKYTAVDTDYVKKSIISIFNTSRSNLTYIETFNI